jgi:hypothetical protein
MKKLSNVQKLYLIKTSNFLVGPTKKNPDGSNVREGNFFQRFGQGMSDWWDYNFGGGRRNSGNTTASTNVQPANVNQSFGGSNDPIDVTQPEMPTPTSSSNPASFLA